jgi:hypothetical protein
VVDNEDEAIAAVKRIGELDRRSVRATFEKRFTTGRMAEDYLRYDKLLLRDETRRNFEPVRMFNAIRAHFQISNAPRPKQSLRRSRPNFNSFAELG